MRGFDASDEHNKELRNDLAGIGQKFDTHAISIKQIELQMAQLSGPIIYDCEHTTTGNSS